MTINMGKPKLNRSKTNTLIFFMVLLVISSLNAKTIWDIFDNVIALTVVFAIFISIYALIKGSWPEWDIQNRKVASIVLIATIIIAPIVTFFLMYIRFFLEM